LWSRFKLCCTCNRNYRKLLLNGKYLRVTRATDPTLILWENLGYSLKERRLLAFFISLVTLAMVMVCVSVYVFGRWADKEIQKFSPQVECEGREVTADEALQDFDKQNFQ
jgi:hypothetical protein